MTKYEYFVFYHHAKDGAVNVGNTYITVNYVVDSFNDIKNIQEELTKKYGGNFVVANYQLLREVE